MGMVIIAGPTGVGKSDLALQIARQISAQIINADVGQFYGPLSIGTAKPSAEYNGGRHHLFGTLNEPVNFTAVQFRQRVCQLVAQIKKQGDLPIIVGGSGFYLKALFFQPQGPATSADENTDAGDWEQLDAIDPARAAMIHPNDRYRIARALAIWYQTGALPSTYRPLYQPIDACVLVHAEREREQLYQQINQRTTVMINQGWLAEAAALRGTEWERFIRAKGLIGYATIFDFLAGPQNCDTQHKLIADIQQQTRHYAKRQLTFWRSFEQQVLAAALERDFPPVLVREANLTSYSADVYSKGLLPTIRVIQSVRPGESPRDHAA